jgi:hypothetical protein
MKTHVACAMNSSYLHIAFFPCGPATLIFN